MNSFSSVMLLFGLFLYNLFNFSVSTFFQSWFPRYGYVVFFFVWIVFSNSSFILSSCVNICFVVLVSVEFRFSLFCVSIRLTPFPYLVFRFWPEDLVISFTIYLSTYFHNLKVRKPTFLWYNSCLISKSLVCIKSNGFCPNFNHSFFFFFLYPLCVELLLK